MVSMTTAEKISMLKSLLDISDNSQDDLLAVYLTMAKKEIIAWHYAPNTSITEVPADLEMTQIQAVVAGYNIRGAENQKNHNENGINRTFKFTDMVQYIRANVSGYAKLL